MTRRAEGGFRFQHVCDLLDESTETLKYWRRELKPFNHRGTYNGREVLALRLVKILIREHFLTPRRLQALPLEQLVLFCTSQDIGNLRSKCLLLDMRSGVFRFVSRSEKLNVTEGRYFLPLDLNQVIEEHLEACLNLGLEHSCPQASKNS